MAGVLSIRVDVNKLGIVSLTNRITGTLRDGRFQAALTGVNTQAATAIQIGMVDQLNSAIAEKGRPQRSGERLQMSILDERNRDVSYGSFVVGRPSWMNKSPAALYWRRIEEGDQTTFDARIFFTNDGTFVRPYRGVGTRDLRMPQGKGVFVQNIGPFPKYEFSRGGQRVLRRYPFKREYNKALKSVGLDLT